MAAPDISSMLSSGFMKIYVNILGSKSPITVGMAQAIMEVFTDKEKDTTLLREYYHGLKNKPNE